MRRNIVLLVILVLLLILTQIQQAEKKPVDQTQAKLEGVQAKKVEPKAKILAAYFERHKSPLKNHAQDFIDAARVYNLDWKLVPAIAGVESTFGKFIPGGYNGWGWGVTGTQTIYFKSWKDGIFTVSKGLREKYMDRGLTNPFAMNRIYATSPAWGGKVTYFMNDLEKFARNFGEPNVSLADASIAPQIAVNSGKLVTDYSLITIH